MPGGDWSGSCSQAVKYRANNLSGVGLYANSTDLARPSPKPAAKRAKLSLKCLSPVAASDDARRGSWALGPLGPMQVIDAPLLKSCRSLVYME